MRRNLEHVKHLLALVEAHADHQGIFRDALVERWEASGGNPQLPLEEAECVYLVNRCTEAGFLSVSGGTIIQLTWKGHDHLDSLRENA